MKKLIATIILVFALFLVGVPVLSCACSKDTITANADTYMADNELFLQKGLYVNGTYFPDEYFIQYDTVLGGYYYQKYYPSAVNLPLRITATDTHIIISYANISMSGGLPDGTYSDIVVNLYENANTPNSGVFTTYYSQDTASTNSTSLNILNFLYMVVWTQNGNDIPLSPHIIHPYPEYINTGANFLYVDYYRNSVQFVFPLPEILAGSEGSNVKITISYPDYYPFGTRPSTSSLLYREVYHIIRPDDDNLYTDYGYDIGYDSGYDVGYDSGSDAGYLEGVDASLGDITPWQYLVQQVDAFFNIPIFGSEVTFGTVLSIGFGLILIGIAIKIFLGG